MGWNESQYTETKSNDWGTPDEVLQPLQEHFEGIGLDPCANPNALLEARRNITLPEDGLLADWSGHGLVYINPPFSKIKPWVEKAASEGDEVILLLPARTGSVWWQTYVAPADVILFWRGRLTFYGAKDIAPFHCALVYWGVRPELFLKAFPGHWYVRRSA